MCFVFCHNDQISIIPLKLDYLWRQILLYYLMKTILLIVPIYLNFLG